MMRTPLVVLVVLAALTSCGSPLDDLGISPSAPLGLFPNIDSYLASKEKFTRSETEFTIPQAFNNPDVFDKIAELKVYQYQEFAQQSEGKHVVLVGVDDRNMVQAIGGQFHSGGATFTTTGTRTQAFLSELWAKLAGSEPTFKKANRPGVDLNEYFWVELNQGGVKGRWEKIPNSGDANITRTIWDMMLIWRTR